MEFQHDDVLQRNLNLKELELENLLLLANKDSYETTCNRPPPRAVFAEEAVPRRQIHFQHFNYPVFNNETSSTCARPAPHKTIKNFVKRDYTASVSNIPYPEESTVNLRQFLVMKGARRVPSAFETMVKKLESVQFHVKELAKQRERMMAVIQRVSSKDASACYTKVERFEKELPTCCRGVRENDFKVIIEKTTAVLQSSTMEANLYRGMMQMIGNKCDTFDSYASMTTRVMLKELEECIDDVMTLLNEFIGAHQSLARFQDFPKHNELLDAVALLLTCIRCCASYTWVMESRYVVTRSSSSGSKLHRTPEQSSRDINIGSI